MTPRLSLLALATLAGLANAQQLVLPDNMNLGAITSSTALWRTTLGRFQTAYDSTHFTGAGVTGPITINRLRFRAEDGQRDLGGHVFTNITVEVGNCAVDHAAMSTTFATNRGTMGFLGTTNVTVLPASGTIPNDYVIDIDLAAIGAAFLYDPTTGTDLLVDISFAAPAPATNLVPFSTGSTTVATARGRSVSTSTSGGLTGSLGAPATLLVDFAGPGGYSAWNAARAERIGVGCNGATSSFYQDFQLNDTIDLANTSLTLTPDNVLAPTIYTVTGGTIAPDLTKVNAAPNSIVDDALVTHALGFTLNYVGGTTTTIKPCTNGYVWLDSAQTLADITPTVAELLGITATGTARVCPMWVDFHAGRNTATHPNSGLHVMTDISGGPGNAVCYATWFNVGVFNQNPIGGTSVNDMQCVFHEATGVIEFRYGSMQVTPATLAIVGFSRGDIGTVASMHPGPRDLSHEVPFSTSVEGTTNAITHNVTARPIQGVPFTMQAFNVPATVWVGAMIYDFAALQPGLSFPPMAPGCVLSVPNLNIYELYVLPVGTVNSTPLALPAGFMGTAMYTQFVGMDVPGNIYSSNGLKLTLGLN
ncbi:MAG TPA: hypothetical protein VF384_15580 [Planctomycetota bacterium]